LNNLQSHLTFCKENLSLSGLYVNISLFFLELYTISIINKMRGLSEEKPLIHALSHRNPSKETPAQLTRIIVYKITFRKSIFFHVFNSPRNNAQYVTTFRICHLSRFIFFFRLTESHFSFFLYYLRLSSPFCASIYRRKCGKGGCLL